MTLNKLVCLQNGGPNWTKDKVYDFKVEDDMIVIKSNDGYEIIMPAMNIQKNGKIKGFIFRVLDGPLLQRINFSDRVEKLFK